MDKNPPSRGRRLYHLLDVGALSSDTASSIDLPWLGHAESEPYYAWLSREEAHRANQDMPTERLWMVRCGSEEQL